ncbi:MAG: S1-like domain-containing RNA-binding protein [Lachnospiraceae bacterium]|nr:S1-like domain-containing RNA-binding protein [Lachnospiraceae bacterium]
MFELGKKQKLYIVKKVEFGVYLSENENETEKVLLPFKQVPENAEIGDTIEVFLYRDSKDRLIATTNIPKLLLGEFALLKVSQIGNIGAFLDWGLEKDLFLPFRQQTTELREGDECLAGLYLDKSNRLCATMKVYDYLSKDAPYKKDDSVSGIVYEISRQFGAFVAVDDKYSALIPAKDFSGEVQVLDRITARVTDVKEDGKLDLSIREKAYMQMDQDAEEVLQVLEEFSGVLPFNDKADPEIIKKEMKMSKNAFKRAVGRLYKEGKIEITDKNIKLIK